MSTRKRMGESVKRKLERIRSGEAPRVLDLFSGCGGMTLGFTTAGAVSVGGVEMDGDAALIHALNFAPPDEQRVHGIARDIVLTDARSMLTLQEGHASTRGVDVLIGGPPCPAFTRVGRAKLRDVAGKDDAFLKDPRAQLYREYLRFVRDLEPLALVMENVPELLNWGGTNLGDVISAELETLGYVCRYTLLNAASYGVPQTRERFFLIAFKKAVGAEPDFPVPSRAVEFPPGYNGTRSHALGRASGKAGPASPWFRPTPLADHPGLPGAIGVAEAIGDLPAVTDHLRPLKPVGGSRRGAGVGYTRAPHGNYEFLMRNWPGFEAGSVVENHVTRSLSTRDYRLFAKMKPGDDYPAAHRLARDLFEKELRRLERRSEAPRKGSNAYRELESAFVPPYDPGKFPNKWRKLEPDKPARTLMAHLGKDTYSHIHHDGSQARTITVREAARLQSFPDAFRFARTMNASFRQIGNSVPPLLAWALAETVLDGLGARVIHRSPRVQVPHVRARKRSIPS